MVALENVPLAGIFGRGWDTLRLLVQVSRGKVTPGSRSSTSTANSCRSNEARVPVLDRGFIFGDGVYEVIPVYSRAPVPPAPSICARLQHSLRRDPARATRMTTRKWTRAHPELVARNPWDDQCVYLQVTRGVASATTPSRRASTPTVFMMANPLATPHAEQVDERRRGVTRDDYRWLRCDIKSISLLAQLPAARRWPWTPARSRRSCSATATLTEASASNVFVVKNGVLLPPPKNNLILPGITYDVVLELARDAGHAARGRARCSERKCATPTRSGCSSSTQGSAGGHDARRQAGRQRQARARVPRACTRCTRTTRRACAQQAHA